MEKRPDVVIIMTDQERAIPHYEAGELAAWRTDALPGRAWFEKNAVSFDRHYTGSLACVPSRPTIFTGQFPDLHGVTQTDGLGKEAEDSRMRWLREGEVPTLGNWFRAGGYDTHYVGKWHISHGDVIDEETGRPLATNDDEGVVDPAAVQRYREANTLEPFGFSEWIGPEPHGAALANSGAKRDPITADQACSWLENRYRLRQQGDAAALVPFLLVVSFVNPHDIVLFPVWAAQGNPLDELVPAPPPVEPAPSSSEDLTSKPYVHAAYRDSYYSGYGPSEVIKAVYDDNAQAYRDLYYRLHAAVDAHLDRVRAVVTEHADESSALLVRTADHGELLGSHGGLHQKWFTLYDEATRVPFQLARVGQDETSGASVDSMVTSHVDLVPTLLAAAGIDEVEVGSKLAQTFTEVHELPGRNLMPQVSDPTSGDPSRWVYLMTRDNILEGDTGASAVARQMGLGEDTPPELVINLVGNCGTNIEGIVGTCEDGHRYKLVRTFDDPATWTEPGVRQLISHHAGEAQHRTEPLPDEWELYDLTADPGEVENLDGDPARSAQQAALTELLASERAKQVPERNSGRPYVEFGS